jgi:cell division protein FtsZ
MIEQELRESESTGTTPEEGLRFTLDEVPGSRVTITVVGIGGCGGNIIDYMIESGLGGVNFACLNTDEQALKRCISPVKLQIGKRVTQGYGTGSNPEMGREAALENTEELTEMLGDADMVFLAVGLGGGTGTGAAPVIGSLAKQMGALTIAAAVKPFGFEGKRKSQVAEEGFQALLEQVDTAIEIPNERLLEQIDSGSGFFDSFRLANQIATETLQGITDVINQPGIMNSDFADIRAVLEDAGVAVVGSCQRGGREAALEAAREAIGSLMVEQDGLAKASKILVNVTGSAQFGMHDASEALDLVQSKFDQEANLIIGAVRDDSLGDEVRVMVVASGFRRESVQLQSTAEDETPRDSIIGGQSYWPSDASEGFAAGQKEVVEEAPAEAAAVPISPEPETELQHVAEDLPSQDQRPELELPSNGGPMEFMPRPGIRVEEEEEERPPATRPGFFRRRSIFR